MENKEFSRKLEKRTKAFAIGIIKLSGLLPNSVERKIIRNQMTKSGTSIGANYREAVRARSRADFKNKIKICGSKTKNLKESSLRLMNCWQFLLQLVKT